MHLEALDLLVHGGEYRPPQGLRHGPVLLHDRFELAHHLAPLVDVEGALGLGQQPIEFGIRVAGLVPRHARAIGETENHDAERPVRPAREPERQRGLVPNLPILGRGHDVDFATDSCLFPLLDHALNGDQLPRRLLLSADLDVDAVGVPGLGQKLLGRLDVAFQERALRVLGVNRTDVVMFAGCAEVTVGEFQNLASVGGEPDGFAHPRVVERRYVLSHPRDPRLCRGNLVKHHMRQLFEHAKLNDIGLLKPVHLLRGDCADSCRRVVAEVDELDRVNVRALAPIVVARLEHRLFANVQLDKVERPGAVGAGTEETILLWVDHLERVVKQVLGHGELRLLGVEPHGVRVELLDRVGVPQPRVFLAALLVLFKHVALHQTEHGRAGVLVQNMVEVPHHIVGGEVAAVVPLDPLAHVQGPGLEVIRGLPTLQEIRPRDVVVAGLGQVLAHLARDVAGRHPAIRMGVFKIVDSHRDSDRPAGRHGGPGLSREALARDLADEGVGRPRRDAEQGRRAQELAPVDLLLAQLFA